MNQGRKFDDLIIPQFFASNFKNGTWVFWSKEEFSFVCKDFEVATDFASSDIGSNLIDMAPRNLDKLLDIDIWVKFQSLIYDKKFPNFPSYREVGSACRIEEHCFVKRLSHA